MDLFGSINLSDIPRELIRTGSNGKKYLTVKIARRREPSQYGHTHYIKAYVKAAERRDGVNYYIGELKESAPVQPQNAQRATMPQTTAERATAYMNAATQSKPEPPAPAAAPAPAPIDFNKPQDDGLPF